MFRVEKNGVIIIFFLGVQRWFEFLMKGMEEILRQVLVILSFQNLKEKVLKILENFQFFVNDFFVLDFYLIYKIKQGNENLWFLFF